MRLVAKVALIAVVAVAAGAAYWTFDNSTSRDAAVTIPDRAFAGFEKCQPSKEFLAIVDDLFAHGIPIAKHDSAWIYSVNGRFMGVELRRLALGVCDISGQRDCGWAIYVSIGFDAPKDVVRKQLQEKTGIDFTEEQRDNEAETTTRPVLSAGKDPATSHMFCDSGSL